MGYLQMDYSSEEVKDLVKAAVRILEIHPLNMGQPLILEACFSELEEALKPFSELEAN